MFRPRITHFPIRDRNSIFQIGSFSGTLFSFQPADFRIRSPRGVPSKIQDIADRCANPYLLAPPSGESPVTPFSPSSQKTKKLGVKFAGKLIRLSRVQFLCARFYASWRIPLFATAREATLFFRQYARGDQEELCLARALFAAKTSKNFDEHGAVVIGIFLPSRAMHAWVIEGNEVADPYDKIWINYQPLAILS